LVDSLLFDGLLEIALQRGLNQLAPAQPLT
jgi:hypothetical protein